jgi:hypothetical protein
VGPIGWGAAIVILAAGISGPLLHARLEADNAALAQVVGQLHARAEDRRHHKGFGAGMDLASAIASQLPNADSSRAFIKDVQRLAEASGVEVDHSEYRLEPVLTQRAVRLRISLPARGEYPALRRWLQTLLAKYPSSSLDDLALQRAAEGAGEVDARVALSLTTLSGR